MAPLLAESHLESALLLGLIALLLTLMAGLGRALFGPTLEDRLSAALLLGTGGVAFLSLLALLLGMPALFDVALLLALLAAVAAVAMTRQEVERD
jgi:multicomponent Na+:H+ antiporter subunit F